MDLGIRGRRAIVCASSRGLGRACAEALAREGVHLTLNAREVGALEAAADAMRSAHHVEVGSIAGDIADEATRQALLAVCPEPDILVNNNGGPPPGRFQDWDRNAWIAALDANMLAPVLMIRAVLDGMVERGFGRIVNITSAMVKTPLAPMGLSTGARAGLTSLCKALSRQVASANVTLNNLLPERIDTDRQRGMAELRAKLGAVSIEQAYDEMKAGVAAGRLGRPEELGDA
jgi:3-oxoacyl-[acyl-carrier protein] reductase